jgi:EmrB/QacA subfamily drug resistance transporter
VLECGLMSLPMLPGAPRLPRLRRVLVEPRRPTRVRESPRAHWYVVSTVCIGAFMGQLDASIVTLALPRLAQDLHASVGVVDWVALSYLLVLAATVATVGRLADAVGRKLLYVYGFGVFTVGSVICGLAPTLAVLIAARVLQAVGAAMLQANSVALITEAMPRSALGRGLGVQGTAQALGLAVGPAIGGVLLSLGGWRLIFLVNVPAGVIGIALGWFLLPRSRSRRPIGGTDRLGAMLLALAAAGPLVYLSLAGRDGYSSPVLLSALVVGLAAAIGFVRHERRVDAPLIDISLFRRRPLATGLSAGLVAYLVLFGVLFVVPYYLSATHVPAARVGLELSALPIALGIAAPLTGRLVTRVGSGLLTGGGLTLTAAGLLTIALLHTTAGLIAGLMLAGLGLGAFTPANNATVMSAAPAGHTGVVSGALNMTRGIGTALGVALATALYAAGAGAGGGSTPVTSGVAARGLTAALVTLALLALATGLALLRPRTVGIGALHGRGRGPAQPNGNASPADPGARIAGSRGTRTTAQPFHTDGTLRGDAMPTSSLSPP